MKNTRKKVLPLLLAGILLLSAGAYGTRAFFTDSAEQEVGIKLTLGDLDIKSENSVIWKYTPEKGIDNVMHSYDVNDLLVVKDKSDTVIDLGSAVKDSYDLDTKITVSNVRPGDAFEREFTFTNNGSLTQRIKINDEVLKDKEVAPYSVSLTGKVDTTGVNNGFILEKGKSVKYTIKIEVLSSVGNAFNNTNKIALDYFTDNLTITAEQPNALVTP
jgi:hypothetical protein